jgi:hypothetical protein
LQWSQDPSEINGDVLNSIRREASRHFRNKRRKYLEDKINDLATNRKSKNIRELYRGISGFKMGYQPRTNLEKVEKGDLLADSHNILNRRKTYFSQLLNIHVQRVSNFGRTEMHPAEPLVPEPKPFEVELSMQS